MHFFCFEWRSDINNLKQINYTFVNLRGAFICFILRDIILSSQNFSLVEWYCLYCLSQTYNLEIQWNSSKILQDTAKKNCRNPGDTQICFNVYEISIRRRLTLINTRSYHDILGVCWSVRKRPSYSCFFINVLYSLTCFRQIQFISFWCIYCLY